MENSCDGCGVVGSSVGCARETTGSVPNMGWGSVHVGVFSVVVTVCRSVGRIGAVDG